MFPFVVYVYVYAYVYQFLRYHIDSRHTFAMLMNVIVKIGVGLTSALYDYNSNPFNKNHNNSEYRFVENWFSDCLNAIRAVVDFCNQFRFRVGVCVCTRTR